MYDFGTKRNLKEYKTPVPPVYNLGNIHIPVYGFIGIEDKLGDPTDNSYLESRLHG